MSFRKLFSIFYKYWDYVSKRETGYTVFEVLVMTRVLFTHLRNEQEKRYWDIEELKYICPALDTGCEDLDPNYFIACKFAYLDHLKTWYHLNNNGWIFAI